MDNGWAIVLGAIIALTGSAVIPWLRETLEWRRLARSNRDESQREAIIELISANASLGYANGFQDKDRVLDALSRRSRAATAVLLAVDSDDRVDLAALIERAVPIALGDSTGSYSPRVQIFALQAALVDWADGRLAIAAIGEAYDRHLAAAAEWFKSR